MSKQKRCKAQAQGAVILLMDMSRGGRRSGGEQEIRPPGVCLKFFEKEMRLLLWIKVRAFFPL